MGSDTRFLCPICGKRMKIECYRKMPKNPKFEIFCEDGCFISSCGSASQVFEECMKTCKSSLIKIS